MFSHMTNHTYDLFHFSTLVKRKVYVFVWYGKHACVTYLAMIIAVTESVWKTTAKFLALN